MTFENKILQIQETKEVSSPLLIHDTSKEGSDNSNDPKKKSSSPQLDYSKRSITLKET